MDLITNTLWGGPDRSYMTLQAFWVLPSRLSMNGLHTLSLTPKHPMNLYFPLIFHSIFHLSPPPLPFWLLDLLCSLSDKFYTHYVQYKINILFLEQYISVQIPGKLWNTKADKIVRHTWFYLINYQTNSKYLSKKVIKSIKRQLSMVCVKSILTIHWKTNLQCSKHPPYYNFMHSANSLHILNLCKQDRLSTLSGNYLCKFLILLHCCRNGKFVPVFDNCFWTIFYLQSSDNYLEHLQLLFRITICCFECLTILSPLE